MVGKLVLRGCFEHMSKLKFFGRHSVLEVVKFQCCWKHFLDVKTEFLEVNLVGTVGKKMEMLYGDVSVFQTK